MKVINGKVVLSSLHFQRLLTSLQTLQFTIPSYFTEAYLLALIHDLIHANHHIASARVRLMVHRGDGGLYDLQNNEPNLVIESFPATMGTEIYNTKGLNIGIYTDAKKVTDRFANIKSNNYLPYVMGALYARGHNYDDCLINNQYNRIADATIANIFLIKNNLLKTPPLSEGCVAGVMRSYLLACFQKHTIACQETPVTKDDLLAADEIFLTNTSFGIRWVATLQKRLYDNRQSARLHQQFIAPLFSPANF